MYDLGATERFIKAMEKYPKEYLRRDDILQIANDAKVTFPNWYTTTSEFNPSWGVFRKATLDECIKLKVGYSVPGTRTRKEDVDADIAAARANSQIASTPVLQESQPVVMEMVSATKPDPDVEMEALNKAVKPDLKKLVAKALGDNNFLMAPDVVPSVPKVLRGYVPWGWYDKVLKIISSEDFLPLMVTGPSGNGKTEMIEQVCANTGRDFIRINITNQTDEDDLIGGFRLFKGDTKYNLGPIPVAMITGAVCLLDEIDLGQAPMMCLQPVLEGKPLFLKKIGKYIYPAKGFTIAATLNTKGRGDDGKYAHTNIMNEAMLERFAVMFDQKWPSALDEKKIIAFMLKKKNLYDADLANNLINFAESTRKLFETNQSPDQIATRRLIQIVKTYATLGNINDAMELALARFDIDTSKQMMQAWKAINDPKSAKSPSGKF